MYGLLMHTILSERNRCRTIAHSLPWALLNTSVRSPHLASRTIINLMKTSGARLLRSHPQGRARVALTTMYSGWKSNCDMHHHSHLRTHLSRLSKARNTAPPAQQHLKAAPVIALPVYTSRSLLCLNCAIASQRLSLGEKG